MAYDRSFYEEQSLGSRNSAEQIVPFLLERFPIRSVVDLGCGLGTWLACFLANGVSEVAGYDGDYVPRDYLQIPQSCFHAADLTGNLAHEGRCSLAMSLEVAEHIPPEKARDFVGKLTALSDLVLFSSAFPYQGGTGHVNENYPEYWAILFRERGYVPLDLLRDRFWFNGMVCPWYRQNMLLFMKKEFHDEHFADLPDATGQPLTRLHPELYLWSCVRPREHALEPGLFEKDKLLYYKMFEAWRDPNGTLPADCPHYGEEYNIEYSEMSRWNKWKLKVKYHLQKRSAR